MFIFAVTGTGCVSHSLFLIQLVIFNGRVYNPFLFLAEKVRCFRRDGFVDDPLMSSNQTMFLVSRVFVDLLYVTKLSVSFLYLLQHDVA